MRVIYMIIEQFVHIIFTIHQDGMRIVTGHLSPHRINLLRLAFSHTLSMYGLYKGMLKLLLPKSFLSKSLCQIYKHIEHCFFNYLDKTSSRYKYYITNLVSPKGAQTSEHEHVIQQVFCSRVAAPWLGPATPSQGIHSILITSSPNLLCMNTERQWINPSSYSMREGENTIIN